MIYLAALSNVDLDKNDFLRLIAHNPQFGNTYFEGRVSQCESTQPEGKMRRFVWQVLDNKLTSNDLTVVILFNETREKRDAFSAQIKLKQHREQVDAFCEWLAVLVKPESREMATSDEGNIVFMFRNCDFSQLTQIFAKHNRRRMASV